MYVCEECIRKHELTADWRTTTAMCEVCQAEPRFLAWVSALERSIEGDRDPVEVQLARLKQRRGKPTAEMPYRTAPEEIPPDLDAALERAAVRILRGLGVDDVLIERLRTAERTRERASVVAFLRSMSGSVLMEDYAGAIERGEHSK